MDEHGGPIDEFGDQDGTAGSEYDADPTGTDPTDEVTGGLAGDGFGDEPADDAGTGPEDVPGDQTGHDDVGLEFGELSDDTGAGADDAADSGPVVADPFSDVDEDDQQEPADHPDPVPGTDPDLDLVGDDPAWAAEDVFPPQLEIGEPPEPVDGFPWSDPAVLGEQHDLSGTDPGDPAAQPGGSAGDLFAYDGQPVPDGVDPWPALAGSEDPATSSLARFWSPS